MLIAKWYKIKLLPRIGGGSHITQRFLRFPESKFSIIICADDSGRRLLRSFQWSHLAEWAANKSRAHCQHCEGSLQWGPAQSSLLIEPIWGSVQGGRKESEWQNWVRSSPGFLSKQFGLLYRVSHITPFFELSYTLLTTHAIGLYEVTKKISAL